MILLDTNIVSEPLKAVGNTRARESQESKFRQEIKLSIKCFHRHIAVTLVDSQRF
jgi:hypothetical protein